MMVSRGSAIRHEQLTKDAERGHIGDKIYLGKRPYKFGRSCPKGAMPSMKLNVLSSLIEGSKISSRSMNLRCCCNVVRYVSLDKMGTEASLLSTHKVESNHRGDSAR